MGGIGVCVCVCVCEGGFECVLLPFPPIPVCATSCIYLNFLYVLQLPVFPPLQLSTCQVIEMRQYTDLLMHVSLLEDSWIHRRMVVMLKGQENKMEGMVSIIQEAKSRYQKKAYLAIKFLVNLFHE